MLLSPTVCIYVFMCVSAHAHVGGGQRSTLGISFNCSPSYSLKQDLSLNLEIAGLARVACRQVPGNFIPIPSAHCSDYRHLQPCLVNVGPHACMEATG